MAMNKVWQVKMISDAVAFEAVRRALQGLDGLGKATVLEIKIEPVRRDAAPTYAPEHLAALTGAPLKVCVAKLQRMVDKGQLDYGTSLNFPWIVPGVEVPPYVAPEAVAPGAPETGIRETAVRETAA